MRVVVVEDDLMIADFLEEALLELGHVVCGVARTVAEALVIIRQYRPDIAVLDMQLRAGELGTDITEQLAQNRELDGLGLLYVSGEAERVQRHARFGHACLKKPYTITSLQASLDIVRELAQGQAPSRPIPRELNLLRAAA